VNRGIAIAAIVLGACRGELPATEIVVTVDTTFGVPCTIDALHIEVVGDGDPVTRDVTLEDAPGGTTLPGSMSLVPRGDPREVAVTVTGMRDGAPFATATGEASFERDGSRELRFVLDDRCVPGPCEAVGVGGFRGLPERQPRRGCGEHGYSWKNAIFVMRDACAMSDASHRTVLSDADEDEAPSPLSPGMPFPFRFYGERVTQVWAGDNGYIGFGDTKPGVPNIVSHSLPLGDPGFPGKGVLAFWDDLRTGSAGVCFAVTGKFPDRILWITWKEACFASEDDKPCSMVPRPDTLTFGIALEETTDRIYLGYLTMDSPALPDRARAQTATIGVTDAVPRGCRTPMCMIDGTCQDGAPCGYTEFPARRIIVGPLPTLEFDPQ
jgi:hypothetical protein